MSQTQSDLGQTASSPAAQTAGAGASRAGDDDPLSHLHKMSTTAGLGSGEYVAVNGPAVFAVLLGLASALSLLDEVLLVVPLTAIVVSIIAWRQINQSNGTQTGKGLVALALALSLGFGGFVVAKETTRGMRTRADREAINRAVIDFGEKIKANDLAGAYAMFSDRFHQQVNAESFNRQMAMLHESEIFGKIKDAQWNGLVDFQAEPSSGNHYAITKLKVNLDKTTIDVDAVMRKEGAQWLFDSMPTFFSSQPQQRPGAGGAAGAGAGGPGAGQ
jgi:hypothetical protein